MKKFYLFEEEEYRSRWQKCQQEMEKEGIDVLVLSQHTNLFYMSGYRTHLRDSNFRPFICVLPKDGEPTLVVPRLEGPSAKKESWFNKVRIWGAGGEAKDAVELLEKVFKDENLVNCTVGMELDTGQRLGMEQSTFNAFRDSLNNCQIKSCSGLMWKLRRVKSKKEIEYMKEACRITDVSFDAVVKAIKVGMNEKEVRKIMGRTMLDEGADLDGFIVVGSGKDRYDMTNPWPVDRKLEKGDMCVLDFGAVYNNYWADVTRGIFIAPISDRQKELYEAILKIHDAGLEMAKPGIPVEEMDKACLRKTKEMGYEDLAYHRTGHSLGLDVHEIPSVAEPDKTIMEPGMCFAIEPGIYDYSAGGFRIEDDIVITKNGFEYLTNCSREVIVK
jgi:Xaa-Pro aminopeptidase